MSWPDKLRKAANRIANTQGVAYLAACCDIPRETLSRFLNGHRDLSLKNSESLARALGYDLRKKS